VYGFGGFSPACFAAGSRIATDRGEVAVEALQVGDRVVALRGGCFAPVSWLGHRAVDGAAHLPGHPPGHDVWPVQIAAGAFAPGQPSRDLRLSPDHAVFVDGGLIPIRYLLNGATITQECVDTVIYWHVELAAHDVLLAEGLPVESYLDTGNRAMFANASPQPRTPLQSHKPPEPRGSPERARAMWQDHACAPLRVDPAEHVAVRRLLLARAAALGHGTTDDPGLRVLANGEPVAAQRSFWSWQARLPCGTTEVRLESRISVPAELLPDSGDCRRLGIAVTGLSLGEVSVPPDDPRRHAGWHKPEAGLHWTDGGALLRCDPPLAREQMLELTAAPLLRYRLPVAAI
jgi:Hint domain